MTISVDDSGWGCLVGPAFVALVRDETGEAFTGEVPLEHFRDGFASKSYLAATRDAVRRGFEKLGVPTSEPVRLCSGYVLDEAALWLERRGHRVSRGDESPLAHSLAEGKTAEYLSSIGAPSGSEGNHVASFFTLLRWVAADLGAREKYVKTGWASWPAWRKRVAERGA